MTRLSWAAGITAALLVFAGPLPAKTISFTGLFEAENYPGGSSPFAEQPATLDVVIEIDAEVPPDAHEELPGAGSVSDYSSAVTSFTYEAFNAGGVSLGIWSLTDLALGLLDLPAENFSGLSLNSYSATGPEPLDTVWLLIQGDANVFSGSGLDQLTTQTLKAMHTGHLDLFTDADGLGFGIRFSIDFESAAVTDDAPPGDGLPAPVPLPAGLPLLFLALGALRLIRRANHDA